VPHMHYCNLHSDDFNDDGGGLLAHMSLLWGNVENSTTILRGGDSTTLNMRWGVEDKSSVGDIYDHATSWGAPSKSSFLSSDMADTSGAIICTPIQWFTVTLFLLLLRLSTQMLLSAMFLFRDNSGSFDSKRSRQFPGLHCLHSWTRKKLNIREHSSTVTIKVPSCTLLIDGEQLLWIMDKTLNVNLLRDVVELYESINNVDITDIDGGIERDGTHFLQQQVETTWISSLGHEDNVMQHLMEQQYACINDLDDRVLMQQLMELLTNRLIILSACYATLYALIKYVNASLRFVVANGTIKVELENLILDTYQQTKRCNIALCNLR